MPYQPASPGRKAHARPELPARGMSISGHVTRAAPAQHQWPRFRDLAGLSSRAGETVTGTAPSGSLDHRWRASDSPAGGYLLRLAIEAAGPFTDDDHQVGAVTLRSYARCSRRPSLLLSTRDVLRGTARVGPSRQRDHRHGNSLQRAGRTHSQSGKRCAVVGSKSGTRHGGLRPTQQPAGLVKPSGDHSDTGTEHCLGAGFLLYRLRPHPGGQFSGSFTGRARQHEHAVVVAGSSPSSCFTGCPVPCRT